MGEALRTYCSTLHSLQMVVAHCSRCLQASLDIGVVNDLTLLGTVRPDAGETVRLQFEIDGERISLGWILAGQVLNLLFDSEDILDVVAEFVRDDVSLGKVGIAAAEASEFIPEAQVDVDLLIRRAIERAGLRLGGTATGLCVVAKEHKLCAAIFSSRLLRQKCCPCFLHIIERK